MKTINERIKYLRTTILNNMNQSEFGKTIGHSQSAVSKIERPSQFVSQSTIMSICNAFNINPDWLTRGLGNIHSNEIAILFSSLKDIFNLSDQDMSFIKTFISLDSNQRQHLFDIFSLFSNKKT